MSLVELIKKADDAGTCCQDCYNEEVADIGFDLTELLKNARVDALDALRGHPAWPVTARETRLADFVINLFSIKEHEIQ